MMKETPCTFINSACQVKRLARSQETREEGASLRSAPSFILEGKINQRSGDGRAGRHVGKVDSIEMFCKDLK